MRLVHREKQLAKLAIEHPEDLWYLTHIIDVGDALKASTERKIKIGGEDARNQKVVRKKMTLTLTVEKVELGEGALRVLGIITDGPEDISRGEHHSFNLQEGDTFTITKKAAWAAWQEEKLQESIKAAKENILVVVFDREEALFAKLTTQGHQILSRLKGDVAKKGSDDSVVGNYWGQMIKQLTEYDTRMKPSSIIAASPAFWKDYVKGKLGELEGKTIFATVSGVDESALNELVKRPELKSALSADRSAKELVIVEELLVAVSKDTAAYGIEEVEQKANEGALLNIIVSEHFLQQCREEGNYEQLDTILKTAESTKAKIVLISTEDALKQLDGLGGIAGKLRW